MKKLKLFLFLLLAAGTAGFFAGRVTVPTGSTAVLQSGLSGILGPFQPDRFNWCWQKLIPGDTVRHLFPVGVFHVNLPVKVDLPGLDDIPHGAPVAGSLTLDLALQLELEPQQAAALAASGVTNALQHASARLGFISRNLRSLLLRRLEEDLRNGRIPRPTELHTAVLQPEFERMARSEFPGKPVRLHKAVCTLQQIPDMNRYAQLRRALGGNTADLTALITDLRRKAAARSNLQTARDALRRHWEATGKLLVRFPALLNFITVQKLAPNVRISLVQGGLSGLMNYNELRGTTVTNRQGSRTQTNR